MNEDMNIVTWFIVSVAIILAENIVFHTIFGINAVINAPIRTTYALIAGLITMVVLFFSSILSWTINAYIIGNYSLQYFSLVLFILIVYVTIYAVFRLLKLIFPSFSGFFSERMPIVAINCLILYCVLNAITENYEFLPMLTAALTAGFGFTLSLVIFSGVLQRIAFGAVPSPFRGLPIALISAGLLSLAFMGYQGLIFR